ncbi:MAG TPA: hypothetical protein VFG30_22090 [Polyangiales bacterium]|nr:hypothetical protein [Polyangiales bacterium]
MGNRPARAAALALAVGCCLTFAPSSRALAEDAAPQADSTEYTHTIEQAVERFRARDFNQARTLFQAAHKLDPSARTLRGVGLTDFESGRYAVAIAELESALADTRKPLDAQQRIEVQQVIAHARGFVGNLELQITPKEASVTIDGILVRGDAYSLDAGEHVLRASASGYVEAEQTVRVLPADLTRAVLTLEPLKPETPTPVAAIGGDSTQLTAAWIVGGIGVAGVIVGSVFGVRSILKHNESDQYCGKDGFCSDPRGVSAMDAARSAGDISTVAFIAGGLALGAGTVLLLTAPSDAATEHPQSATRVLIGPGAVRVVGVF